MFWGKLSHIPAIGFAPKTVNALQAEARRARKKFPTNRPLLVACTEEIGELAKALAHGSRADVEREAIQLASTALRIAEEGDSIFDVLTPSERQP